MGDVAIIPGRSCGTCTLCCKLMPVDEIGKPVGQWCKHCAPGRGCTIYENRPGECRSFHCAWLTAADVGPEWQPLKSKMVVYVDAGGQRLGIHVDPSRPMAWREEPYYSQLKEWAVRGAQAKRQVIVYIKDRVIVLLPGKEVDLGVLARGDQVVVTSSGNDWTATRVAAKDVANLP